MDGWIRISRRISRHWLWTDAERLKWWLDMLLMAAWEEREVTDDSHTFTLHKGQFLASLQFLVDRWHKSKPTIVRFLRKLEMDNMISRKTLFRHTCVITVVNYERYQTTLQPGMGMESLDEQDKDFKTQMQDDNYWCDVMAMRFHLTPEQLQKQLDAFFIDQACRGGNRHTDIRDAKQHFNNWLLIQQQIERRNETTGNSVQNKRRGVEATLASAEDYKTTF